MNQLETELRDLLEDRARQVDELPRMEEAVRRAKLRRAMNAGTALLAVIVIAAVGTMAVRAIVEPEAARFAPATPDRSIAGEYGFGSESSDGDYPIIASGVFRDASWELIGKTVTRPTHDTVEVRLEITKDGRTVSDQIDVLPGDDVLMNRHMRTGNLLDGADAVFGATVAGVDLLEVEVAGEATLLPAHTFRDYDSRSTITADYYIAFVPSDSAGSVHARNELGVDLDTETYGDLDLAPALVASGRTGSARWALEFDAVNDDRACLVFATSDEVSSECFTREQIESAGPLLVTTFEREEVLGVVAIMSAEVAYSRVDPEGSGQVTLPWSQPAQEDLDQWPLRLVAVGLEPGTHGTLQALDGSDEYGGDVIAEEPF